VLLQGVMDSHLWLHHPAVGWPVDPQSERTPSVMYLEVDAPPPEFEEMFVSGRYTRESLAHYRVECESVFHWAVDWEFNPPEFVVPLEFLRSDKPENGNRSTRPETEDKQACQEIAKRKWAADPDIRIAVMARDPEIKREGNGALYTDETIWRWLREVAPAGVKGRPGRPAKRREPGIPQNS